MQSSGHRNNYRMPPRSATAPLPRGPPSPELSNLDCAFPPFPTSKARSATPTRDYELKNSRSNHNEYVRMHTEPSPLYAPVSPRRNGGGKVLQRMNMIAPGPFDLESVHRRERSQGQDLNPPRKTTTVTRPDDFPCPPNSGSAGFNFPRPSTAGPEKSRKLSLASISGGPRSMLDREGHQISSTPAPSKSESIEGVAQVAGHREHPREETQNLALRHEARSQTFPIYQQDRGNVDEHTRIPAQSPSEPTPAPRNRRPTVTCANHTLLPMKETDQDMASLPTQKPAPLRPQVDVAVTYSFNSNHGRTQSHREADIAPKNSMISVPDPAQEINASNSHHTPTASVSSNGSYGSDARSGSSRSSPPLSDASISMRTKPMTRDSAIKSRPNFQAITDNPPLQKIKKQESNEIPAPRDDKAMHLRPAEPVQINPRVEQPESPMDPAMRRGLLSPFPAPNKYMPSASPEPPQLKPPPARRTTAGNKGNCRGCGELIKGKSVSSADGRLTGRYHKQCFVCKTCRQPFQTADFYVINNYPYCERHYHQLNHSLCRSCDGGIEGQYLATENKEKFHPHCFTCQVITHLKPTLLGEQLLTDYQDCNIVLKDDYFEMNGKVYCEQHAFRAAQQSTFLGAGRKNPERRTTRLMMM